MKLTSDLITITKPHIKNLTQDDINEAAKIAWSLLGDHANDYQFTAFTSFVLTTPRGTLARSVMLRLFNEKKIFACAREFTRFTKRKGKHSKRLLILRNKQKKLFLTPVLVANNKEVKRG